MDIAEVLDFVRANQNAVLHTFRKDGGPADEAKLALAVDRAMVDRVG